MRKETKKPVEKKEVTKKTTKKATVKKPIEKKEAAPKKTIKKQATVTCNIQITKVYPKFVANKSKKSYEKDMQNLLDFIKAHLQDPGIVDDVQFVVDENGENIKLFITEVEKNA